MRSALPRSSLFSVSFHPNVYYPSWPMQCILADYTHVLRPLIISRMQSHLKKGLWVRISANRIGGKAVVRRWATRRVREAVRVEFAARGLGIDGAGANQGGKGVNGTMEVIVRQPSLEAKWHYVKTEMGRAVEAVMKPVELHNMGPRKVG